MVFHNIFASAKNAASAGEGTSDELSNYIATDSPCVPPHDPMKQSGSEAEHDPKIVRETSPEASSVLNFINGLAGTTQHAAEEEDTLAGNPGSTVEAAGPVMEKAHETTGNAETLRQGLPNDLPKTNDPPNSDSQQ